MNFESCFVIDLRRHPKRRRSKEVRKRRQPTIVELLDLAEEMQLALDDGTVNNRAELAWLHGLSRARITQVLALLRLHPDIRAAMRRGADAGKRLPSERQLRPILRLSASEQLVAANALMSWGVVAPQGRTG
jgi:hypothetical protein